MLVLLTALQSSHEKISATNQKTTENSCNHAQAARKSQQPSRTHQEITATIQKPPKVIGTI